MYCILYIVYFILYILYKYTIVHHSCIHAAPTTHIVGIVHIVHVAHIVSFI